MSAALLSESQADIQEDEKLLGSTEVEDSTAARFLEKLIEYDDENDGTLAATLEEIALKAFELGMKSVTLQPPISLPV